LLFGYRHFIINEQRIGLFQGLWLWVLVGWKWHQVCPFYSIAFLSSSTLETTPGCKRGISNRLNCFLVDLRAWVEASSYRWIEHC
jgi:hypothetical protein